MPIPNIRKYISYIKYKIYNIKYKKLTLNIYCESTAFLTILSLNLRDIFAWYCYPLHCKVRILDL